MEIFSNCRVITMDTDMPYGDYMAVEAGKVVEIGLGTVHEKYEKVKRIDLKGGVVIPGFWESHLHIATGMRSLMELNLRDCSSGKQLKEKVENYCRNAAPGEWIIGHGWDERKLFGGKYPDSSILDELCSSHPMVLIRMDGHSICINTIAINNLGLQGLEPSPEAPRRPDGRPLGMFYENTAADILASIECLLPDKYIEKVILSAQDLFLKNGITTVNDICIQYGRYLELYRKLWREGKLKLRIIASPNGADEDLVEDFENSKACQNEGLRIGPAKFFMDGSFGSRTGLLWEEYADDPGNNGLQLLEEEELKEIITANYSKGHPINIHAIGDKAVCIILDAFDKLDGVKGKKLRSRIEHIQIIRDEDIDRFSRNHLTASFQPAFLYEVELTGSRIGKERLPRVYRIKSFIDKGVNVILNSDWPYGGEEFPQKHDKTKYIGFEPILGIHAACCRQMNEREALIPEQALKCYTVNPAYVNYREKELGMLKKGYLADFTVLSRDITAVTAEDIINTEVLATYVKGEMVYEK